MEQTACVEQYNMFYDRKFRELHACMVHIHENNYETMKIWYQKTELFLLSCMLLVKGAWYSY